MLPSSGLRFLAASSTHFNPPQEFADRQQISLHTVRTQFKAAAARVGTNRQADLVRIVLTGPAVLRWSETRKMRDS